MGFNSLKTAKPLPGDSLLFTTKSLGVPGIFTVFYRTIISK